ncbi:unnamed protein product [Choristocarpus tenellus]
MPGGKQVSLTGNNLLLRGCQLRNTDWVCGAVVYAGRETKIQMNAGNPPMKTSALKSSMDRETLRVLAIQALCCLVAGVGASIWVATPAVKGMDFLWGPDDSLPNAALTAFLRFWSFIIIFTNFIPISLLVTVDMVKFFQSLLLMWDICMFHEVKNRDGRVQGIPMQVRSSDLNEELGMVEHVFSDKTGTLTCNVMDFRKCSIRGQIFGLGTTEIGLSYRKRNNLPIPSVPLYNPIQSTTPYVNFVDPRFFKVMRQVGEPLHRQAHEFCLHLALNHEVQSDHQSGGDIVYSASNPDDQALIYASKHFGYRFMQRDGKLVTVAIKNANWTSGRSIPHDTDLQYSEHEYEVLHTFPFTSDRKRSTVVEDGQQGVIVYCKGADNIILERQDPLKNPTSMINKIKESIAEFTNDGE